MAITQWFRGALLFCVVTLGVSGSLLHSPAPLIAQDESPNPGSEATPTSAAPEEEATADFRGKVTLAYGLVFGAVVVFLLLSAKKNAGMREEIEFLSRRLDELERRGMTESSN